MASDLDPAAIAAKLTTFQAQALANAPKHHWFSASEAGDYPSNVYYWLSSYGLFHRRADPTKWGRSQYLLAPDGLSVRAALTEGSSDE